jgi:hypothetical protein
VAHFGAAAGLAAAARTRFFRPEHGEINPMIDPHRTAIMLIGTVRGIIMQWLLNPKKKQLLTLMRHHYTLHKASMTRDHWYFSTYCQKRSATWRLATSLALVCW